MSAGHWKLDNLICLVDVNNQQADGPSTEVLELRAAGRRSGRRSAGTCSASTATTSTRWCAAFDAARDAERAEAARHHLRHQDGQGRAVPRGAREDPLPARRAARMAAGARGARRREERMSRTKQRPAARREQARRRPGSGQAAADHLGDDRLARRRGQRTKPAPFGHALVELGEDPARDRRHDRRPRQVHRPAHLRARPIPTASTRWAWPSSC